MFLYVMSLVILTLSTFPSYNLDRKLYQKNKRTKYVRKQIATFR